jgi:hypothetical protein
VLTSLEQDRLLDEHYGELTDNSLDQLAFIHPLIKSYVARTHQQIRPLQGLYSFWFRTPWDGARSIQEMVTVSQLSSALIGQSYSLPPVTVGEQNFEITAITAPDFRHSIPFSLQFWVNTPEFLLSTGNNDSQINSLLGESMLFWSMRFVPKDTNKVSMIETQRAITIGNRVSCASECSQSYKLSEDEQLGLRREEKILKRLSKLDANTTEVTQANADVLRVVPSDYVIQKLKDKFRVGIEEFTLLAGLKLLKEMEIKKVEAYDRGKEYLTLPFNYGELLGKYFYKDDTTVSFPYQLQFNSRNENFRHQKVGFNTWLQGIGK